MYKPLIYNGKEHTQFLINKKGHIINTKTNRLMSPYLHKTGYYYVSLPMGKRGNVKTIRLHKALAETFLPNPTLYKLIAKLQYYFCIS